MVELFRIGFQYPRNGLETHILRNVNSLTLLTFSTLVRVYGLEDEYPASEGRFLIPNW